MKKISLILALLALVLGSSCRRTDLQTHTILIPEMRTDMDAIMIKSVMTGISGIAPDKIEVSLTDRSVSFEYESMVIAKKNLEILISDLGFSANEIPPDPKASANRQFYKDYKVRVREMSSPSVANYLIGQVNGVEGVVRNTARFYQDARQIGVIANSSVLTLAKLERAISEMGFSANALAANPAARGRLPAELRAQMQPRAKPRVQPQSPPGRLPSRSFGPTF